MNNFSEERNLEKCFSHHQEKQIHQVSGEEVFSIS